MRQRCVVLQRRLTNRIVVTAACGVLIRARIDGALKLVKSHVPAAEVSGTSMLCTGGGAYKFGDKFHEQLVW